MRILKLKQLFLLGLGISLSFSLFAQKSQSFTLEEATKYAMANSTSIQNATMEIEDAEAQINERRAIGLPKVSATLDYQYFFKVPIVLLPAAFVPAGTPRENREVSFQLKHNFNAGIGVNSLIFDGTYITALKAAKLYREYVNQDLIAKEQEVRNSVADAYLPSLILSETIVTLNNNITNLDKLLFETKELYKAGFVEQLDVDRLELSKANIVSQRENLVRQRQMAIDALKFALSYPIADDLIVEDDIEALLIEATDEDLTKAMSYYDRAEYKVAETGLKLNDLNIEQYQKGYLPNVVGFASYGQGFQGNKLTTNEEVENSGFWADQGVVGATVNIPIYDGGDKKAKIQRAKIQKAKTQNQIRDLERVIDLQVKTARSSYINAKDRVANQKKNLELAEKIYNTTQVKYKEGVGSSLEIVSAEQSLYQSQQNYTQALYDLLVAKTELNKALGK